MTYLNEFENCKTPEELYNAIESYLNGPGVMFGFSFKFSEAKRCAVRLRKLNSKLSPVPQTGDLADILQWCIDNQEQVKEKQAETEQKAAISKVQRIINWIKKHPHSYGLTGGVIFLILFFFLGLFKPQWRQWCWGTAGIALLVLILSLLGGRSRQ